MIWLVLLIAVILRFYQLGSIPPALDWDEASTVYNGYSILKTGSDEFGQSFPILFRAFDGYVPPVLVYLNSLSTAIFGLNEFAARFPNAFLGTLTVFGVWLLTRKLTGNKRLASLAALILAISPYHIIFSRVNFFASLPVFFLVFGTYFFLVAKERGRYLILSVSAFILAIFSYFSAYIFAPILALSIAVIYRKKFTLGELVLFLIPIVLAAFLILLVIPGGRVRGSGVSAFNNPDLLKQAIEQSQSEGLLGRIAHNRRLIYLENFLKGYFSYFRFDFLFDNADAVGRVVVPGAGFGLLYWWDLPFLLAGLYFIFAKKPPGSSLLVIWLLAAPIAAATALPQPASTRMTVVVPAIQIMTAYGFWFVITKQSKLLKTILVLLLAFNFYLFAHQYFTHFAKEKSSDWFYGYRQLYQFLDRKENTPKNVHFVFKGQDSLDQVHMFTLFYNKIDPKAYQENGGTRLRCIGTTGQFSFGRYHFLPYHCLSRQIDWASFKKDDLIVTSRKVTEKSLATIEALDKTPAFYIYEYGHIKNNLLEYVTN